MPQRRGLKPGGSLLAKSHPTSHCSVHERSQRLTSKWQHTSIDKAFLPSNRKISASFSPWLNLPSEGLGEKPTGSVGGRLPPFVSTTDTPTFLLIAPHLLLPLDTRYHTQCQTFSFWFFTHPLSPSSWNRARFPVFLWKTGEVKLFAQRPPGKV